ncbi:MAG: hypothetical protein ABEJ92_04775 [Halobacteriales archaeon]
MSADDGGSESLEETFADGSAVWERETAPQSPYSMRQVGIGLVVLVAGAVVAFGLPLALA